MRWFLTFLLLLPGLALAQPRSVAEVFARPAQQALLMRIEVALAQVQARHGVIPAEAAAEIARTGNTAMVTPEAVAEERRKVGHPMVSLINVWARVARGNAGEFIHYGATTQDIFDTAAILQCRQATELMLGRMLAAEAAMVRLAEAHRATPMIGRTVGRHALPITFGLKVSSWMAENRRNIERLRGWLARTDTGMLSGAVGSYAALGPQAFAIEAELMRELGLGAPWPADWKGAKDMFAEWGALLAVSARSWGRIAQEIFILQGDDIREVVDPSDSVGSSTMPHKVNPGHSRTVVAQSRLVPALAVVLQDWQVSIGERDQISNAETLGELGAAMDRLLVAAAALMQGLEVLPDNMRRNLGRTNGLIMAEHAMFLLGERIGKHTAHEEVRQAALSAGRNNTTLVAEIMARPALAAAARGLDLQRELDPTRYLGLSPEATDRAVAAVRAARGG